MIIHFLSYQLTAIKSFSCLSGNWLTVLLVLDTDMLSLNWPASYQKVQLASDDYNTIVDEVYIYLFEICIIADNQINKNNYTLDAPIMHN